MATDAPTLMETAPWRRRREKRNGRAVRARLRAWTKGTARIGAGLLALALFVAAAAALVSYTPGDPSLNTATGAAPQNLMGHAGAWFADIALQGLGFAASVLLLPIAGVGLRLLVGAPVRRPWRILATTVVATLLAAIALGLAWPAPLETLTAGSGGIAGLAAAHLLSTVPPVAGMDPALILLAAAVLAGLLATALLLVALAPSRADWRTLRHLVGIRFRRRETHEADTSPEAEDIGPEPTSATLSSPATAETPAATTRPDDDPDADADTPRRRFAGPVGRLRTAYKPRPTPAEGSQLPPLSLLQEAPPEEARVTDETKLEENARLLESVLDDYGVKGRIIGLAEGPVVTLYELEPAPGIKSSRVIGLADDIARSMSAVSARVAVIPGRNVIGIELPNSKRATVHLSELIGSEAFQNSTGTLPIILGKDITGEPVIADLAPMPHLLIAGTTGSGKSVALNAMILSLLYRLQPEECRLILIDPKMLELSVYDDIPHLLSHVVTEPQKAVRALKWAVEQMEERYRNMAHVNVRSLSGFNEKVRKANLAGEPFVKRVQTGWDADGQPEFEEVTLALEPLPLIVIVVDELADLMMTAGKEVEFLIQRLAQKARAAGIHLIMATQRPSVDVITGVIKANLPTRISFQVTSKIDSRTILGEQGAEQLLGRGDMLYMPGGKRVLRVHGPFVSDEDVEAVADHWRAQGSPEYIASVTEEPEGGSPLDDLPGSPLGDGTAEDDRLQQAIQIVAASRRATISYLQRQLRVGYNTAARLIDQMQDMGLISTPDHVGRREVLMDETGERDL